MNPLCEECKESPHSVYCLNCTAFLCIKCNKNAHKSRILRKHLSASSKNPQHILEHRRTLHTHDLSLLDTAYADQKENEDMDYLIQQLATIYDEQASAFGTWQFQVKRMLDKLEAEMGRSIDVLNRRMRDVLNHASDLAQASVEKVDQSHFQVIEAQEIVRTARSNLPKNAHNPGAYMKPIVEGRAAIQLVEELEPEVVTEADGTLVLTKIIDETAAMMEIVRSVDPDELVSIEYPSNDIFHKATGLFDEGNYADGIVVLERVANLGFYPAQVRLAQCYANGIGSIDKDAELSVKWGIMASESPKATGDIFYLIAFQFLAVLGDLEAAMDWARKGADIDDIGCLKMLGTGLGLDEDEALQYHRRAAELGDFESAVYVGRKLQDDGLFEECEYFFKIAADTGNMDSQYTLAMLYVEELSDYSRAALWFRKAALQGHAMSQYHLAKLLDEGFVVDDDNDPEENLKWFELAAMNGVVQAQYRASVLYEWKDVKKSEHWLRKAADQGLVDAQVKLGCQLLESSRMAEAFVWFARAAERNDENAYYWLGKLYLHQEDYAQALQYFLDAAGADHSDAMIELGKLYMDGNGVNRDRDKAKEYLLRADELGNEQADELLAILGASKNMKMLNSEDAMRANPNAILIPETAKVAYLFKLAGKRKYQRTLFVFTGPYLSYFKNESDSYPAELINIRDVDLVVPEAHSAVKGRYYFTFVVQESKQISVYTTEARLRDNWCRSIGRAISYYTEIEPETEFNEVSENDAKWSPDMISRAIRSGWLSKQGGKRKKWNKRFFVMIPGFLYYFKDEKAKNAAGVIDLEYASAFDGMEFGLAKKNCIAVVTFFRTFFLQANTYGEANDWTNAISAAVEECTLRTVIEEEKED